MQHKFTHYSKTKLSRRLSVFKKAVLPVLGIVSAAVFSPILAQSVVANDDVAHVLKGGSVVVDVLKNDTDTASAATLRLDRIVLTNYGAATIENGKIRFIPLADFVGSGVINYTVCNAQNQCDCGNVIVEVARRPLPTYDSNENSRLFVLRDSSVRFILPIGYQPSQDSDGAIRSGANAGEWIYTHQAAHGDFPQYNFSIVDNGTVKGFDVKFEALQRPPQYVVNDVASTSVGKSVTVNVLTNDKLPNNFASISFGNINGGTIEAASNGNVTFTPNIPNGGVATVEYAVTTLDGYSEKATVFINVSNFLPARDEYRLTCSGVPFILNYKTPIDEAHMISILDTADNIGRLQFFESLDTVVGERRLTGKKVWVYFPNVDEGYYTDVMALEYCLGDDCKPVFIEMEVTLPDSDDKCSTDCVWPGDANADGTVNVLDLFPIGLNIGQYGAKRTDDSDNWYGHSSTNWGVVARGNSAIDLKHADGNGDGVLDSSDVTAIVKNYNSFAAVTPKASIQQSDVQVQLMSSVESVRPGEMIEILVSLGSSEFPAYDLKGTSFSVGYNANLVEEKTVNVSFTKSGWLSRYDAFLMLSKGIETGKLEAGLVKTKNRGSNGYGIIGKVQGVVIEDVVGFRRNAESSIKFTLDDVVVMTGAGQMLKLKGTSIEIPLSTGKKSAGLAQEDLFAYPNPTSDVINFFLNGENSINSVRFLDMSGREVARLNQVNAKSAVLNVSNMANGLYIAEVMTAKGRIVKKIEVMK